MCRGGLRGTLFTRWPAHSAVWAVNCDCIQYFPLVTAQNFVSNNLCDWLLFFPPFAKRKWKKKKTYLHREIAFQFSLCFALAFFFLGILRLIGIAFTCQPHRCTKSTLVLRASSIFIRMAGMEQKRSGESEIDKMLIVLLYSYVRALDARSLSLFCSRSTWAFAFFGEKIFLWANVMHGVRKLV